MTDNPKLERLAIADLSVALGEDRLAEIADLVLRRHQRTAAANGAILAQHQRRTYAERSDTEQLGMRSAVARVLESLVLLDVVVVR